MGAPPDVLLIGQSLGGFLQFQLQCLPLQFQQADAGIGERGVQGGQFVFLCVKGRMDCSYFAWEINCPTRMVPKHSSPLQPIRRCGRLLSKKITSRQQSLPLCRNPLRKPRYEPAACQSFDCFPVLPARNPICKRQGLPRPLLTPFSFFSQVILLIPDYTFTCY